MRKIRAKFDNRDRVVCVSGQGKHRFYYQPAQTGEQIWLFDTKDYSESIFNYFRSNGTNLSGRGIGLTIKQLYACKEYKDRTISVMLKRLPGQIEYVIRERLEYEENKDICAGERVLKNRYFSVDDNERIA